MASLLFISGRCRLEIQTEVDFLCTRVAETYENDCKKMKRVLQYLIGTINLVLMLGAYDITKMKLWVNVLYRIHSDCERGTKWEIYWGWGVILSKYQKQKLNTKSSTESEIVGVSN